MTMLPILTVGHSTHAIEQFIALLQKHHVGGVVDVRSAPYSRWQPQFNRPTLSKSLKAHQIQYAFLGKELGARSDDRSCYEDGRVQYRRLARTELFQSGLEQVRKGSERRQLVLMCAEKDPLDCHRAILVARELIASGATVAHIHADGHIEPHGEAMKRLLQQLGLPEQDMFRSADDMLEEGYARQEERIAYVSDDREPESEEARR